MAGKIHHHKVELVLNGTVIWTTEAEMSLADSFPKIEKLKTASLLLAGSIQDFQKASNDPDPQGLLGVEGREAIVRAFDAGRVEKVSEG